MTKQSTAWIALLLLLLLGGIDLRAQVDTQLAHYWAAPSYFNAGAVGRTDRLNMAGVSRTQWVGVTNAPQTFLVTADMPLSFLKKEHGVGLLLSNETIGLYENIMLSAQYAYKLNLWGGRLSIGGSVGMYQQTFDSSGIIIPEGGEAHNPSEDEVPTTELQGYTLDLGLGVFYTLGNYYAGISTTHLSEAAITFDEKFASYLTRSYYLMAGGNIPLKNPLFEVSPSILLLSTGQITQLETTLRLQYNSLFTGGVSYRWNDALAVMVGARIKDFTVGYAYEYPISAMVNASSGSHEVYVGYSMKLDLSGGAHKGNYKSIRIL